MTVVVLKDELAKYWSEDNAFEEARAVEGEIAKAKDNRRVVKFSIAESTFYLKYHQGVGWKEIFKNLLQAKLPVLGAANEWYAIERLKSLNIDTMEALAFGKTGFNPAKQESFLVTRELKETVTLEQFCGKWKEAPPSFSMKKALIDHIGLIAKKLHENGLNHRDLYLCHFLLDTSNGMDIIGKEKIKIYLVDLHRMQIRQKVPLRWLVKDIASLYFSSMDLGFGKKDYYRFIKTYTGMPLRRALAEHAPLWRKVRSRAKRLYLRDWDRIPTDVFVD